MDQQPHLSRRERQIMDIIYAVGRATANEVLARLPDPPSRDSVRALLRILEEKGHLRHEKRSRAFVYLPTRSRSHAGRLALRRMLDTFFGGSLEQALTAHLSDPKSELSPEELKRLSELIRDARRQEKQPCRPTRCSKVSAP